MDGSPWLQAFHAYHRPDAVRILDVPHAVELLNQATQVHPRNTSTPPPS